MTEAMRSVYERMLDVWVSLGGEASDRSGPAWTWRPNPSPDALVRLLSHPPTDLQGTPE